MFLTSLLVFFASAIATAGAPSSATGAPPELHAAEIHSQLGMVATGSPEATEADD